MDAIQRKYFITALDDDGDETDKWVLKVTGEEVRKVFGLFED